MTEKVWQSPVIPWDQCDPKRQAALRKVWSVGDLRFKMHPSQLEVHEQIRASWKSTDSSMERLFACDISRQHGKDFLMSCIGIGECLRRRFPTRIVYFAPTKEMLKELIVPTIVTVFQDCPPELRPIEIQKGTFERTADTLTWPWGGRIPLVGGDLHPDRLRGPATYGFLGTEVAFIEGLVDLTEGVLLPQLLTIPDGWVIYASTPPVVKGHPWTTKYIPEAKTRGMYAKRVITDNPRLSKRQVEAAIKSLGGPESTRVRRELFCEHIVESEAVVIPEFSEKENIVPDDYPMPTHVDCYTALDPGIIHAAGGLGAWFDFENDRLVIDWDFARPGLNSAAIARIVKAREWQFWGKVPQKNDRLTEQAWEDEIRLIEKEFVPGFPVRQGTITSFREGAIRPAPAARYSDTQLEVIASLSTEHGLVFSPARKDDLEAQINAFRLRIGERRIVFKARCVNAINHVQNAQWTKQRTKFAEQPGGAGHFDCLAAGIYLNRMMPWGKNPNPTVWKDPRTHHIPRGAVKDQSPTSRALRAIFRRGR